MISQDLNDKELTRKEKINLAENYRKEGNIHLKNNVLKIIIYINI